MGSSAVGLWEQAVKLLQKETKDQASCSAPSLYARVEALEHKLQNQPPLPKATLKELVLQLQVPLHVGAALSKAVQHGWNSPGTYAALLVLHVLFNKLAASGLMREGAAACNLFTSMRQQLQQAGVMQHLTSVMAAMAADLRSEAAAVAGRSYGELCSDLGQFAECKRKAAKLQNALLRLITRLLHALRILSISPGQTPFAISHAWLCDPSSGHVEATMQLCTAALQHRSTAALQHSSSVLQHLLPVLQQRVPQQADALQQRLHQITTAALQLGESLAMLISQADLYRINTLDAQAQQGEQQLQLQPLQQLLLSPHCLPFVATSVALNSSLFGASCSQPALAARGSQGLQGSSAGSNSSSSKGSTSRGRRGDSAGGIQHRHHGATSTHSSSGDTVINALTPFQLQLFGLLGLSPQLTTLGKHLSSPRELASRLLQGPSATASYHRAVLKAFNWVSLRQQDQTEGDEQRWRFEQKVWLLLPSVLLPSANNLLLLASGRMTDPAHQQQPDDRRDRVRMEALARGLVDVSNRALHGYSMMTCLECSPLNWALPDLAWARELLDGVLQLADQLLLQQPSPAELHAKATAVSSNSTPAATPAAPVSSNASSSEEFPTCNWLAGCAGEVMQLPTMLVYDISAWFPDCRNTANPPSADPGSAASPSRQTSSDSGSAASPPRQPSSDKTNAATAEVTRVPTVPLVAERFVKVCTALAAASRTVTLAVQNGHDIPDMRPFDPCLVKLFLGSNDIDDIRPGLARRIGLHGPARLALELRQCYSVLSTVQKLGRCKPGAGDKLCWEQHVANTCCWASARAAVASIMSRSRTAAASTAAPTAGQQAHHATAEAEGMYLPSLVILGRSCLAWAEQLKQQAPELLLLLASGAEMPEQQQGEAYVPYSAARMCVPGWREGQPAARAEPCGREELLATVASWVGRVTSSATDAALAAAATAAAAAAGWASPTFKQQLEALSAAQQRLRQEGVTDASLAAVVQQLQATGVMLSGIAVPLFCNNPACVNITGPTKVQLVSGRSCICTGCRTARYCGRGCQRQDWRQHKPVCKVLAAAAAASRTGFIPNSCCQVCLPVT